MKSYLDWSPVFMLAAMIAVSFFSRYRTESVFYKWLFRMGWVFFFVGLIAFAVQSLAFPSNDVPVGD
jgi:protein-S-isoprenylcysteine O-methyltransferase Ste14